MRQPYLVPMVQLAYEQVQHIEVPAVKEQVGEAQHGGGTHHATRQFGEPRHRLNDAHRDEVEAREGGDHGVPLTTPETNIISIIDLSLQGAFF